MSLASMPPQHSVPSLRSGTRRFSTFRGLPSPATDCSVPSLRDWWLRVGMRLVRTPRADYPDVRNCLTVCRSPGAFAYFPTYLSPLNLCSLENLETPERRRPCGG